MQWIDMQYVIEFSNGKKFITNQTQVFGRVLGNILEKGYKVSVSLVEKQFLETDFTEEDIKEISKL